MHAHLDPHTHLSTYAQICFYPVSDEWPEKGGARALPQQLTGRTTASWHLCEI